MRVKRDSSWADRTMYRQTNQFTQTHMYCNFPKAPCQQQTTAVLRIKHWLSWMKMDRDSGLLSSMHLLSCFSNLLENVIMRFSIFTHVKWRHLLNWSPFALFDVFNMVTLRYLCVYHPRCSLWFMSGYFFLFTQILLRLQSNRWVSFPHQGIYLVLGKIFSW